MHVLQPRSRWLAMLVFSALLGSSLPAQPTIGQLYFTYRGKRIEDTAPLRFRTTDRISVELELQTTSLADRTAMPDLVIDDYRYDEPTYFTDKRRPNVQFEVSRLRGHSARRSPYRVASQGSGSDVERMYANVWFELGRSRTVYWLRDHLGYLGAMIAPHAPGIYRIRARYRGLVTPPITVAVQ